jgi:hypothetical protein
MKIYQNGALLQTITPAFNPLDASMSPDGQFIIIANGGNPWSLQLFQATGSPAAGPSTSSTGGAGGGNCFGCVTTTTATNTFVNYIGPALNATQKAVNQVANPANFTLPVLLIIIVVTIAILLGATQEKKGPRQPSNSTARFRNPSRR